MSNTNWIILIYAVALVAPILDIHSTLACMKKANVYESNRRFRLPSGKANVPKLIVWKGAFYAIAIVASLILWLSGAGWFSFLIFVAMTLVQLMCFECGKLAIEVTTVSTKVQEKTDTAIWDTLSKSSQRLATAIRKIIAKKKEITLGNIEVRPVFTLDEDTEEEQQLGREIAKLLNAHSRENKSDTPDFVLARYLTSCLKLFEEATKDRDRYLSGSEVGLIDGGREGGQNNV